jgi:hypothetical protein
MSTAEPQFRSGGWADLSVALLSHLVNRPNEKMRNLSGKIHCSPKKNVVVWASSEFIFSESNAFLSGLKKLYACPQLSQNFTVVYKKSVSPKNNPIFRKI